MPVQTRHLVIDTPSPELKRAFVNKTLHTPKGVCRKILNSPALLRKQFTDLNELTMSPLVLSDSPIPAAVPVTPSDSCDSTSVSKSPRLKQTSTPGDEVAPETPSNKNRAFVIETNISKAKRRLIEDTTLSPSSAGDSVRVQQFGTPVNVKGNVAKKIKVAPKPVKKAHASHSKKRYGSINAGVGHKIRRPKPNKKTFAAKPSPNAVPKANRGSVTSATSIPEHKVELNELKEAIVPATSHESIIVNPQSKSPKIAGTPTRIVSKADNDAVINRVEKKFEIVTKNITRNWFHGLRQPKERKFFKSRGTAEQSLDRVVTVSVNENLK